MIHLGYGIIYWECISTLTTYNAHPGCMLRAMDNCLVAKMSSLGIKKIH